MLMRGALVRALEWRARCFSDPADRLQFLRHKLGTPRAKKSRRTRSILSTPLPLIAIVAILTAIIWSWISSKRVAIANASASGSSPRVLSLPAASALPAPAGHIWMVQSTPQFDLYSNGLRIENQYATSTAPRRYQAFAIGSDPSHSNVEWRTEPAGIVYHTTESNLAPFTEDENQALRRAGEGLLEYVQRRHSYHFVIDRFGRVFRVVRETDYANHAGNSIWADRTWIYINLNQSFFGVAFEASSKSSISSADEPVNGAQVYAARILTDMLRARYGLVPSNCVTHAQVSVSPVNRAVGYHRDWAANLPFSQLGLADNYKLPVASVTLFGFEPDAGLTGAGPVSIAEGLAASDLEITKQAAAQNLPVGRYRQQLQKRYRDAIRALRGNAPNQEYN